MPNLRARHLLDDNQVDEFKEAFRVFDVDGGGTIDTEEYSKLMAMLGMTDNPAVLSEMFQAMDGDADGELQFEEFLVLMATLMHAEDNTDDVSDAFELLDADGRGWIPIDTCRYLLEGLAENLTDDEVAMCLSALDPSREGRVSSENIKGFLRMTLLQPDPVVIEDSGEEENATDPASSTGRTSVDI